MKGVIIAGGLGTRLRPLTFITNKHLLPIYDKPMILYPLNTLVRSGLKDVLIITGREFASHFMNFLGSGKQYGVKLSYAIQDTNDGGIADALSYAEDFSDRGNIAVILGDNIFEEHFARTVSGFRGGATSFLKKVKDPRRFGCPVFAKDRLRVIRIEEKPSRPKSPYADVGFYLFDHQIFEVIRTLTPSARGQLEIVDAMNKYIQVGNHQFRFVRGFWSDAGTFESIREASHWVRKKAKTSNPNG